MPVQPCTTPHTVKAWETMPAQQALRRPSQEDEKFKVAQLHSEFKATHEALSQKVKEGKKLLVLLLLFVVRFCVVCLHLSIFFSQIIIFSILVTKFILSKYYYLIQEG